MANIDRELSIIRGGQDSPEGSERGENVRIAIADAIKKIYNEREYPPTTLNVHNNGTVEGGPWNKVVVDVPEGGVDVGLIDSLQGDITENAYYTIQKLKDIGLISSDKCIAVDGFTVNVKQKTGEYGEIVITENGTYDPLLDGYDGYSKVYVNVLGGSIKDNYTVRFFDGKILKEVKSVPRGTNAVYTGGPLSGSNFTGWNPSPVSVSRDMDCYAVYADGVNGAIIDKYSETIMDSWAQIIQKVGSGTRPYPIGSTKHLALRGYNNAEFLLNMCLIGYNSDKDENGKYVSTWMNINNDILSSNAANNIIGCMSYAGGQYNNRQTEYENCHSNTIWWGNSLMRALWNGDKTDIAYDTNLGSDDLSYFNAMAAQNLLLPTVIDKAAGTSLYSNIKRVIKYSCHNQLAYDGATWRSTMIRNKITKDKIWLPSTRELAYPLCNSVGDYTPTASLPSNMCSIGAADSGNTQYGNPNTLGNILLAIDLVTYIACREPYATTYYSTNTASTALLYRSYNAQTPENRGHIYITNQYSGNYTAGSYMPIAFCI